MKKIAFIIPWFDENIPGGAEMELRGLASHLSSAGVALEILTTCVKELSADWNVNYFAAGVCEVMGLKVRRFKVNGRTTETFHKVNLKLMNNLPISQNEEDIFLEEMVNSQDLYDYIESNQEAYELFVFIPYMFGTTYYGAQVCPEKSVLIPCLHDESYAYMRRFKEVFSSVRAMAFNAEPESVLAHKIYDLSHMETAVLGIGLETEISGDKQRFIEKYNIHYPYILYAGRKDAGKNVDTLLRYFGEYKKRNLNDLKLILIGGGEIEIPSLAKNQVIDLGFVPMQDKYDAYSGSLLLCQPSKNESFSLVIMESWLCKRPVLVHEQCKVTKHFASTAGGGLYFNDYFEFEGCVNYFLKNTETANQMGLQGYDFVKSNFSWDIIVDKYIKFFKKVSQSEKEDSDY